MLVLFTGFGCLSEEILPRIEILFHNQTDALRVQTVLGEIAVVGLIVYFDGKIAAWEEQVANVEVANKAGSGIGIVAIAELSVDEQSVVEQSS